MPEAAFLGQHRLALDQRLGAMILKDAVDYLIVLGGVARPMHVDAVGASTGLELLQILVEMSECMLVDRRGEGAQLLPFGNPMHLAVALLPQVPQPLVMHLLVLGRRNEARGGFRLVDRPIAMDFGAARLRLGPRAQWLRHRLGVIEPLAIAHDGMHVEGSQQLGIQHLRRGAHRLAPRGYSLVGIAGSGSRSIYAASRSRLRPPGPKTMT